MDDNDNNGWHERMDKLEERHEALTQTVELIAGMQRENEGHIGKLAAAQAKNETLLAQVIESINSLARIALPHERRLNGLEGQG